MNRGLTYGLCLRTPVGCEPVSAPNSLLTGKLTGNLPISGVSAANLTTSLRACARPDRATWAACRRRRGDRVVFLLRLLTAAIGTKRTFRDVCYSSASGGKADISQRWRTMVDFMSTRLSLVIAPGTVGNLGAPVQVQAE